MRGKFLSFVFVFALVLPTAFAGTAHAADVINPHSFDALLHKYVNAHGRVNYAAWSKNKKDLGRLNAFLKRAATAKVKGKSKAARLAFYIDVYNATVIDSILEHYPTKSVMKVPGFFKKITHKIAGKTTTLDALETNVIRGRFHEPRVHFVLVCGAKSCPRLRRHALTAKNLHKTLNAAAREFVRRDTHVTGNKVTTSQIFNWFGGDFKKAAGSVPAFLARYMPKALAKVLKSGKVKLQFSNYNWQLNKQ